MNTPTINALLLQLMEECAEVTQAASKAQRFGLKDEFRGAGITPEKDLYIEINDVYAVMQLLKEEGLKVGSNNTLISAKKQKIKNMQAYSDAKKEENDLAGLRVVADQYRRECDSLKEQLRLRDLQDDRDLGIPKNRRINRMLAKETALPNFNTKSAKTKTKSFNVAEYVKTNWSSLPISTFNNEQVVIIKTVRDDNEGHGHHSYEGYGVNIHGDLLWCYSSGCSCGGTCHTEHVSTYKTFEIEWPDDLMALDPENLNFVSMQVSFSDY